MYSGLVPKISSHSSRVVLGLGLSLLLLCWRNVSSSSESCSDLRLFDISSLEIVGHPCSVDFRGGGVFHISGTDSFVQGCSGAPHSERRTGADLCSALSVWMLHIHGLVTILLGLLHRLDPSPHGSRWVCSDDCFCIAGRNDCAETPCLRFL